MVLKLRFAFAFFIKISACFLCFHTFVDELCVHFLCDNLILVLCDGITMFVKAMVTYGVGVRLGQLFLFYIHGVNSSGLPW